MQSCSFKITLFFQCFLPTELQAVFSVFDKDGDGFVSMEEVGKVLTSMGVCPSDNYIREIFQQVDLDGDVIIAVMTLLE